MQRPSVKSIITTTLKYPILTIPHTTLSLHYPTTCAMARYQSPSTWKTTTGLDMLLNGLAIPIYALAWVILWLAGTILEFAVFVFNAVASGQSLSRKYFEVSLAMPVFALFCLGMLFAAKCIEYLIEFLYFLISEDPEETAIDDSEKLILRRKLRARRGY